MSSLVSVIVPVYNVEKYLPRCIDSILAQTYRELELILVDDGSPDHCGRICDEYAAKDCRVRVLHKNNEGVSAARNDGVALAQGTYLMFVDSDDYISADAVRLLYERMTADGSDMAIGKHTDKYDDGHEVGTYCEWMTDSVLSSEEVFLQMGEEQHAAVSVWGKLFHRSVIDGMEFPELICGEDMWVFFQSLGRCRQISFVDATIYFYYVRTDSVTHGRSERSQKDEVIANLRVVSFLRQMGYHAVAQKWLARTIDKALMMTDRPGKAQLFLEYLDDTQRKQLLRGQSLKLRVKWAMLNTPVFYSMVEYAKRMKGRMKG